MSDERGNCKKIEKLREIKLRVISFFSHAHNSPGMKLNFLCFSIFQISREILLISQRIFRFFLLQIRNQYHFLNLVYRLNVSNNKNILNCVEGNLWMKNLLSKKKMRERENAREKKIFFRWGRKSLHKFFFSYRGSFKWWTSEFDSNREIDCVRR